MVLNERRKIDKYMQKEGRGSRKTNYRGTANVEKTRKREKNKIKKDESKGD